VYVEGAINHVTARGDNREPIPADEGDYRRYLSLLDRNKARFRFLLHAYALMPNHVHLVLEPSSRGTVSQIMQCQTIAYTKYFNKRHDRVGHAFQGRFHSRLIEEDVYLLVASRYVHRNPVRAKLVQRPHEWRWSSYGAYQDGAADARRLTDTEPVLSLMEPLGYQGLARRQAYLEFVETPWISELGRLGPSLEEALSGYQIPDI
jgi:REP element-mobilizing transposase RayT